MLGFARGPGGRFFIKDATNVTAFDGTMDDGGGAGKFCKAAFALKFTSCGILLSIYNYR